MARKKGVTTDTWSIAQNKKTDEVIVFQQDPEDVSRKTHTYLGFLNKREDAEAFRQYKELGIAPDAVAFLCKEHNLRKMDQNREAVDEEKLAELVDEVKISSGRTCFGSCKSIETSTACAICYEDLRSTWELCATICCLMAEKKQRQTNTQTHQTKENAQ